MPFPTEQQRAVLSIDLGASYTKIAWRPRWEGGGQDEFNLSSVILSIDGKPHIPSISVDLGDGQGCHFGTHAEKLVPGPNGQIYRNWKSTLFDPAPDEQKLAVRKGIAVGFFEWIKRKLENSDIASDVNDARLRVCIPALSESGNGEKYLKEAAFAAGWKNGIEFVSEPAADLIGLASAGKNIARKVAAGLKIEWDRMFPRLFFDAMTLPAQRRIPTDPVRFFVMDIGSFTTDVAICDLTESGEVRIRNGDQRSFKHGIAQIDKRLAGMIATYGVNPEKMCEWDFRAIKEDIYQGNESVVVSGNQKRTLASNCMDQQLSDFAEEAVQICSPHLIGCRWYVLTGGGFEIPQIRVYVNDALQRIGMECAEDHFDSLNGQYTRVATALGGASIVLDCGETPPAVDSAEEQIDLNERVCSCGGNKDCARCYGKGVIEHPDVPDVEPPLASNHDVISEQVHEGDLPTHEEVEEVGIPTARPETLRIQREPKVGEPYDARRVTAADLIKRWDEPRALAEFTLDGWMGELVFGGKISKAQQQERLRAHSSAEGKASWLRLLCLATCFGVRVNQKRERIEPFWRGQLAEVWQVFTSESEDKDWSALNAVFINATHRQFRDLDASGEDAELWRRVFYDFRKLHQFVYRNSFPEVVLELAARPETSAVGLVYFMKSGIHPDGRWAGVLGQSMTSPLLFVMRELRRLDIVDSRFDSACFYMNSPARNVATRLGWIEAEREKSYGIQDLTRFSVICHKRMLRECESLAPFFDLALQWYAFNNW